MALTINGTTGIETNTDTGRVKVGANDDLEMYHDGSYSKIKTGGTSHLFIQADYDTNQWLYLDAGHTIELRTTGYETAVKCNPNGSVDLYHNNTKQCETSANGLAFPSGKGIDFSATSEATGKTSELLDDYEEGTWTPVAETGTVSATYAKYIKIGSMVTLFVDLYNFSDTSSTNDILVSLPFSGITNEEAAGAVHGERVDTSLLVSYINSAAYLGFRNGVGSSNYSYIRHNAITDGGDCNIKTVISYLTAS